MNKVLFLFGFAFLLISCSSHKTIAEYFADIEISEDPGYGYSAENPIKLRVGNQQRTIQEMYAFLSGLRKMDGNPLKLVGQAAVMLNSFQHPLRTPGRSYRRLCP